MSYLTVLSSLCVVRYTVRLAVYDEHTMSVKSHQLPNAIRIDTEATIDSTPEAHTHIIPILPIISIVPMSNGASNITTNLASHGNVCVCYLAE